MARNEFKTKGPMALEEAIELVKEVVQEPQIWGSDAISEHDAIIQSALSGDIEGRRLANELIVKILNKFKVNVESMSQEELSNRIFKNLWGLDILQDLYDDPAINEIQVNGPEEIYVKRNNRNEQINGLRFRDNEHIMTIISRMVMHDRGTGLNKSQPVLESMRKDGTRITATCPDVSPHVTLALRKHTLEVLGKAQLIESQTLDDAVFEVLSVLAQGRANILIAGGVGSGKTTLLRTIYSMTNPMARTVVMESDRELLLGKYFPERNIIEFEEHPEADDCTLKRLFRIVLRYSPNMIIVGEFRGEGEARAAIEACMRGHEGSLATAHFSSPWEAIDGTARLLLAEGLNFSIDIARAQVANAFNVVIQMFGDTTRGIIKLEKISEIQVSGADINLIDLVEWVPDQDDYLKGEWVFSGTPSNRLISRLKKFGISNEQLIKLGWLSA